MNYEVVSDTREKVGKKHNATLKLKANGLTIDVTIWGDTPDEVNTKVVDFLSR